MSTWIIVLFFIGAALMMWSVYRGIKHNPQAFSKVNLSKSFYTMGLLAVGLIAFIYILILLVK